MSASSADRVLDWNIDYWQESSYGSEHGVEFFCMHTKEMSRPDRRCKTGVRTWHEYCHHRFENWYTIRELIETVSEHVEQAHPEAGTER